MVRRLRPALALCAVLLALTGCSRAPTAPSTAGSPAPATGVTSEPPAAPPAPATGPVPTATAAEALVAALNAEQRVGQLFVAAVAGAHATRPSDAARQANEARFGAGAATPAEVVARYHLGGVVYFDHRDGEGTSNTEQGPAAVAALSAGLQQAAGSADGVGLWVSIDQEGGRVNRLGPPVVVFPPAADIGAVGDPDLAREVAHATGAQLAAVGVNWVFAPVADILDRDGNTVIGDRAFGSDPELVAAMVAAQVEGFAQAGLLSTLKHFPGHGDTAPGDAGDTHHVLATVDHGREEVLQRDLLPFRAGVAAGADAVMVGHLWVPAFDAQPLPATLSPRLVGLLRRELPFDGLVVTDALDMGALVGFGTAGEVAVAAVRAGVDVLLNPSDLPGSHAAVLAAYHAEEAFAQRVDESVLRILEAKVAHGVLDPETIDGDVPTAAALEVRERLRDRCGC